MDVRLHWEGEWPDYLASLAPALEALPETDHAPDGEVLLCPDASAIVPPRGYAGPAVAVVPDAVALLDPGPHAAALGVLAAWAGIGARFVAPSETAAERLRVLLKLPGDRVLAVAFPLPADRVPDATEAGGQDVLAIGPVAYNFLLSAVSVLRLGGIESRCVLAAAADAEPFVRPGGLAGQFGLMAGHDVVAAADWRQALAGAGVIVLCGAGPTIGWTLREVLATGKPVVAPSTPLVQDHLSEIGATAYLYPGAHDLAGLTRALTAALRRDRGVALEAAAREAVLAESWTVAARQFYAVLHGVLKPPETAVVAAPVRAVVTGEHMQLCVLNPRNSGGGGERFMRQLVHGMAVHASAPRIKLICALEPDAAFDAGTRALEQAGVEVMRASPDEFQAATAGAQAGADLVYCAWPHLSDPPATDAPLVCTFHDVNWKHFDVMGPTLKELVERQSPQWFERCTAVVHSSEFIRDEVHRYYGVPRPRTRVIPLTADASEPPSAQERTRVRRRFALPERFLLSPAGCHLHKNYPGLDAALRMLRRAGRPVTVVATGLTTDVTYHGPDLIGLGYVSALELRVLYEECDGMVQTSLYEAGSFPMGEAMAIGRPVAISRIPPIVEQAERLGVTAEMFDPLDPADIARALRCVWEGSAATEPQTLAANAAAVKARTWDDVATDYLELFAEVVRRGSASLAA